MSLLDAFLLDASKLDVWIAFRTDGVKGSGTESDPYDGSTAARFDGWMDSFPVNTTIHLGPGVFETKGFGGDGGWQPKSGQKILGSGIDVTILKVVGASIATRHYVAIGAPNAFLVGFEAADFTVDCNMAGQTVPSGYDFAPFACGAISTPGAHVRLRRIRAINWGTQTAASECFPIVTAGASVTAPEAVDCVVEDCIVEQPALNNVRETSCINLAAGEHNPYPPDSSDPDNGMMAFHRGCAVRNCVVDCEYRANPLAIESISIPDGGGVSTLTARVPHNLSAGQWIRINGALVAGALKNGFDNGYNGSYTVNSINPGGDNRKFTYMPATPVPTIAPAGEMWVGRWPSHYVAISTLTPKLTSQNPDEWTITVETATAHFLVEDGAVKVNNVNYPDSSPINGVWVVSEVVDRKTFKYVMKTDPGSVTSTGAAFIGVTFQGVGIDGGSAAVMEGNRVSNCRVGGPWHDSYSSKDIVARKNHYRAVVTGPFQALGGFTGLFTDPPLRMRASSLTHSGADGKTATFTLVSTKPHGLMIGQGVRIVGAKINSGNEPPSGSYNGYYAVDTVSATSFTYRMQNDPTADADLSPKPELVALWQLGQCVIENNVIELIPTINAWGPPVGILFFGGYQDTDFLPFRIFRRVVVRNNVIRFVDGLTEDIAFSFGIDLYYCEDALVEDNVVDLVNAYPIRHHYCTAMRYFNNTNSAGQLIQGAVEEPPGSGVTPTRQDELTTRVEDAAILSIL